MTTLLATTTIRRTPPGEVSGFVYTVDLEAKRVAGSSPMIRPPLVRYDTNPRGGMRGGRGLWVEEDKVFIANHSSIFQFSPDWSLTGETAHPSCASIHDICVRDGSLWVTSARNDLVFEFDRKGTLLRHINLRRLPAFRARLDWMQPNLLSEEDVLGGAIDFRDPRSHRYETYDGLHVNSVGLLSDGDLLVSAGLIFGRAQQTLLTLKTRLMRLGLWQPLVLANRLVERTLRIRKTAMNTEMITNLATGRSAIVRIGPKGDVTVPLLLEDANTPAHSLLPEPDGTVLLDVTSTGELIRFDPDSGKILSRVKVTDRFLRGICRMSEHRVAVGAGAELCLVDMADGAVADRITLSTHPNECVFAVQVLPPNFAPLPPRLFTEAAVRD
jgi:hypothetical protein